MGGDAIEAGAKSLNIITKTMQKRTGHRYKQALKITSGKKGKKESNFLKKQKEAKLLFFFFLSSAADGDIVTAVYSNWHALVFRGSCICLQSIDALCYSCQFGARL